METLFSVSGMGYPVRGSSRWWYGPILLEAVLIPGGCGDARVLELHRPKHRAGVVRVPDRHLPRPGPALRVLVRADHKQVPAVVQHGLPDAALPQAVHGQTQGEALPGCARIQTDSRKIKRHGPRIPVQADVLIAHPVQHRPDALRRGDPGRLGQKIPQLYHRPHRGVECSRWTGGRSPGSAPGRCTGSQRPAQPRRAGCPGRAWKALSRDRTC